MIDRTTCACDFCRLQGIERTAVEIGWVVLRKKSLIKGFELDVYMLPKGVKIEERYLEGSFKSIPSGCENDTSKTSS